MKWRLFRQRECNEWGKIDLLLIPALCPIGVILYTIQLVPVW